MADALVTLHAPEPNRSSSPEDEEAVRRYASEHGLTVNWAHGEANTMSVSGDKAALARMEDEVPGVLAVLGLDDRPIAHPLFFRSPAGAEALTPVQVAKAYNFPTSSATGQRIALIELGGAVTDDVPAYFKSLGMKPPTVNSIPVAGGHPKDDGPQGATGEVMLDVEVAGAVAGSEATLDVYFAPNTDAGFVSAINGAVHGGATLISISWGGPEDGWRANSRKAMDQACASAQAAGIAVLAAAGDAGSSDGETGNHVDYPASSPNVTACGGTRLTVTNEGLYSGESVWNDAKDSAGGGGYSAVYGVPEYQSTAVTGRHELVPDVSGNADPVSGYPILIGGQTHVFGGTSAVAPLYAGMCAVINAATHKPIAHLGAACFANPTVCRDVSKGSNGAYRAKPGVDPASGLGSIDGSKLLAAVG
jgi:kumamolisin